jgi:hypothetical protein
VQYLQHTSDKKLEIAINSDSYDDSQLIELKVPINLPYQTAWSDYQRYDGEIEIKGTLYKYVKRKVANDTLYVMCIPNTKKMHLESAKDNFFKLSNDLAQNNNSKKSNNSKGGSFKNQQNEYDQYTFALNTFLSFTRQQKLWLSEKFQNTFAAPHISPEQPPDSRQA